MTRPSPDPLTGGGFGTGIGAGTSAFGAAATEAMGDGSGGGGATGSGAANLWAGVASVARRTVSGGGCRPTPLPPMASATIAASATCTATDAPKAVATGRSLRAASARDTWRSASAARASSSGRNQSGPTFACQRGSRNMMLDRNDPPPRRGAVHDPASVTYCPSWRQEIRCCPRIAGSFALKVSSWLFTELTTASRMSGMQFAEQLGSCIAMTSRPAAPSGT